MVYMNINSEFVLADVAVDFICFPCSDVVEYWHLCLSSCTTTESFFNVGHWRVGGIFIHYAAVSSML